MPALSLHPMFSLVAQFGRQPAAPLRIWLRTTGNKIRPPRATPHRPIRRSRQDRIYLGGRAGLHQQAEILVDERPGPLPTIVIGGFVPDAVDALYLLRASLTTHGSVYYMNYPPRGFSVELFLAQLEDLIEEMVQVRGQFPALMAVSFGAGIVLEALRRAQSRQRALPLAGLVLVSPVACTADLLDATEPKASTLLGRIIKPYLGTAARVDASIVEKSRAVFLRMFESGAQNKAALRFLLTRDETSRLRDSVLRTINAIDGTGASERVRALADMPPLSHPAPLFSGPSLVLFAEKETSVLVQNSPTWREFRERCPAWFPHGRCLTVTSSPENPVQHASLIFHARNFQPHLVTFYRMLRNFLRQAA